MILTLFSDRSWLNVIIFSYLDQKFAARHGFFDRKEKDGKRVEKVRSFNEVKDNRNKSGSIEERNRSTSAKKQRPNDKNLTLSIRRDRSLKKIQKKDAAGHKNHREKLLSHSNFISCRNNYKKTLEYLSSKEIKPDLIEQIQNLVKFDFSKKLRQLVELSD